MKRNNGIFSFETQEYIVNTPLVPKPLENYLFNDSYFTSTFNTGNGSSKYFSPEGEGVDIIGGQFEPGFLENSRIIYIKDEVTGDLWNVGYYPVCMPYDQYECRHGNGYTLIKNLTKEIEVKWRIFVPEGEIPVEIWTLEITNTGKEIKKLSVFSLIDLALTCEAPLYGHTTYLNSLILKNTEGIAARKTAMNLPHNFFGAVFISSQVLVSRDARMSAFTGEFRTLANPVAVEKGICSESISSRDRIAGVLHNKIQLSPEEEWRNDYVAGAADVFEVEKEAQKYHHLFLKDQGITVDKLFNQLIEGYRKRLDVIVIKTPDRRFDSLINVWIPKLIEFGATHCRWATYGYRDIVQQAQGVIMGYKKDFGRKQLEKALKNQYQKGYAVRSFPVRDSGDTDSMMKYADSAFWLIYAVTEYIKETGDENYLQQIIPFLDQCEGTVLEHLEAAMQALEREKGPDGLCLIYEGDWNDSLTHVGRKGKGESVMLSECYCYACLLMEELFYHLGNFHKANEYREKYNKMKDIINRFCWDGEWYIRAIDDNGNRIGSHINTEGQIFLNSQAWAMIAGIVSEERIKSIMQCVDKHLSTSYGYMLSYPVYSKIDTNIGRLTCIEPGCSENASVYTHGNAFYALGLYIQGKTKEAWSTIKNIMPYNENNPSMAVLPYQLSNAYGGKDHRYEPGRAQYGWVTGSGSWLYMTIIDYLFGLKKSYDGIYLKPHIPEEWDNALIKREYRKCTYNIEYSKNTDETGLKIIVNNYEHNFAKPLPVYEDQICNIKVLY